MQLELLHTVIAVLRARFAEARRDEAGISEYVILMFIMATAALAIGGLIASRLVSKANSIPLN